ncbi:ATP-dependent RecD-like DNA helicase [Daejeonella sp.]|uniref:ATP-dependent DNA helicase n=1 Tax=Daejeonella sp. TaxID=2805397 RepID=UPI00271DA5ED|nr:AAA family ATPase [Daejeonella sp.]MDO8993461.1 AAA family ATPase [Daejeonella sp.]MDP2413060.1 AAA family ATPase [Daejeonella sp.]
MYIRDLIEQNFGKIPTAQQREVFVMLEKFLSSTNADECFILKGYAGTGKTTLISALVKVLPKMKLKSVLLAPTGRAAKVISNYSGKKAFTIHKKIYRKKVAASPEMNFVLGDNIMENTLFIVDEASMISDQVHDYSRQSLLQDLISYVYNGKNCKLMLVGDTAQLPPVGSAISPALNKQFVSDQFRLSVFTYELTDVVRQEKESGILFNATQLRELVRKGEEVFPKFKIRGYKDIFRMTGERLIEGLNYAYDKYGMENSIVICRSNKNANAYNQNIRNRILYREEELSSGDHIMVVRNNYFWLKPEDNSGDFIANGDIAKIRKVRSIEEQYGFRFAELVIELLDYPDQEPLSCKVMLDTLYSETPSLSNADNKRFYEAVLQDYMHIENKKLRMEELKKDPYYNALQIKFAFAVTCHKAQGGQWPAVFIDQGYLTDEMLNTEFLRWLYTGVTRSNKELFLVNFSDQFFLENNNSTQ